jgi:enterochelin esterase-like enzyme
MRRSLTVCVLVAVLVVAWTKDSRSATFTGPTTDANGFSVYNVQSAYQSGTTKIRVLYPNDLEPGRKYPVVYILPVEAGLSTDYGDGLVEIKNRNLHNKYSAIFVQPTFSDLPWYADHPTNRLIRQESYLLNVVVPFVDQNLPVQAKPAGRLLLGFSKSGWGAYSLLLRNTHVFEKAVAWDAPLAMQEVGQYGNAPIFATQTNFAHYRITNLLNTQASILKHGGTRLFLAGYSNFRSDIQQIDGQMTSLGIPHEFRGGPYRAHTWTSGWVPEAVELLMAPVAKASYRKTNVNVPISTAKQSS